MSILRRLTDQLLARIVPEVPASACKEYARCVDTDYCGREGDHQICYYGCGRPAYCKFSFHCCPS